MGSETTQPTVKHAAAGNTRLGRQEALSHRGGVVAGGGSKHSRQRGGVNTAKREGEERLRFQDTWPGAMQMYHVQDGACLAVCLAVCLVICLNLLAACEICGSANLRRRHHDPRGQPQKSQSWRSLLPAVGRLALMYQKAARWPPPSISWASLASSCKLDCSYLTTACPWPARWLSLTCSPLVLTLAFGESQPPCVPFAPCAESCCILLLQLFSATFLCAVPFRWP